jgi:2-polyprenyl-6-methoxyphenol hydroxylase-like FAD-dependent oxidoreductase
MAERLRTLIVGAGVAGLTLAALLRRDGHDPLVIDQRDPAADAGYALALWPHGTRVFHALGMHDAFVAQSEPMRRYVARGGDGRPLTASTMPDSIAAYGHLGLVPRADLVALLRQAAGERAVFCDGLSIDGLTQRADRVEVRLSDGRQQEFDLVVGADGVGSRVRELLLGYVPERDTGWGCVVWWADPALAEPGETTERYGTASFVGTYPCRDRLCVIAGMPVEALGTDRRAWPDRLVNHLEANAMAVGPLLEDLPRDDCLQLWRMADVRAPRWVQRRVVLVGDAATAFLPTAGIGASMALESAAVLADELSRTSTEYLPNALALYERRRRRRVETAQAQSRRLAQLMFLQSPTLCAMRNGLLRFATMEQLVGPLVSALRRPI